MELFIQGKNKITLTTKNFVSSGGEGSVYAKNNIAYKIFKTPKNMIPEAKILELSAITLKNIIKPEDIILNDKNTPVGYTMQYIDKAWRLCQLFTKTFKDRYFLTNDSILNLVNKLRDGIQHVHSKKILIKDLNELNYLVDTTFKEVYFIDVDSYETKSFPCKVIMLDIYDRHCKNNFSELTDWFSFGILAFQMFIGVHPYRGKHDKFIGENALFQRMDNNISVFNKDVRLPGIVPPIKTIPNLYREWFFQIFEKGKRLPPPFENIRASIKITEITKIVGTNNFIITELNEYEGDIISFAYIKNIDFIVTSSYLYINNKQNKKLTEYPQIAITEKETHILIANSIEKNKLTNISLRKTLDCPIDIINSFTIDGRIYTVQNECIYEILFTEMPHSIIITTQIIASILPHATQIFDGFALQNLLNSYHVSFFPKTGEHYQLKLSEINGYRIINGKYIKRILMLIGEKRGIYSKFIFKINNSFTSYTFRKIENINYSKLNFTVLDNGVCVNIDDNDYVELFSNNLEDNRIKLIQDTTLSEGKLFNKGTQVLLTKNNKLYSVKMK